MSALYRLCKEEVTHCKQNSLLDLAESFAVEEVTTFKKTSNRVLEELLILDSQVKEDLLKRIRKSPFFWYSYDEVTDIANKYIT